MLTYEREQRTSVEELKSNGQDLASNWRGCGQECLAAAKYDCGSSSLMLVSAGPH